MLQQRVVSADLYSTTISNVNFTVEADLNSHRKITIQRRVRLMVRNVRTQSSRISLSQCIYPTFLCYHENINYITFNSHLYHKKITLTLTLKYTPRKLRKLNSNTNARTQVRGQRIQYAQKVPVSSDALQLTIRVAIIVMMIQQTISSLVKDAWYLIIVMTHNISKENVVE